jgi:hypothetical protein
MSAGEAVCGIGRIEFVAATHPLHVRCLRQLFQELQIEVAGDAK